MDNHRHQKPWNPNFNWRSIYFQCKYAVFHLKSHFKNPQVNKQCTTFFSCFEKKQCDLISCREYMAFFDLCDFYPAPPANTVYPSFCTFWSMVHWSKGSVIQGPELAALFCRQTLRDRCMLSCLWWMGEWFIPLQDNLCGPLFCNKGRLALAASCKRNDKYRPFLEFH